MDHPEATPSQIAYASDFQNENPNTPAIVRDWLNDNFTRRFRQETT
jgi:hypothetical protein